MRKSRIHVQAWLSFEEYQALRAWFLEAEAPFRYMNEDIKFW